MIGDTFQLACPRCRTVMWVHVGSTTSCSTCNEPLATQIAQASMGTGLPEVPQQMPGLAAAGNAAVNRLIASKPTSAKKVMLLLAAGIVVMVIATTAWFVIKRRLGLSTAKGNLAYAALGIDMKHGDPDQMIAALDGPAHRWARDAVWWSLNLTAVGADGTMDLSDGGATITYISPSRVSDYAPSGRKDAIKDFSFGPAGVGYASVKGVRSRWTDVHPPHAPGCSIKQLVSILRTSYGLTAGKTVKISFDPQTSSLFGPVDGWHVIGTDPAITMTFAMSDCSVIKPT
jgi:hypothetical protein